MEDRRLEVLRAIVEDFVATQEPVGSKALAERHHLGVSPATLRNDMASLEDEGYVVQPHTSAGRVPTAKGYRLFVDRLSTVKPLSAPERRAIASFLEGAVDLDDVVRRSVRLLAQLTRHVAVVQYPSLQRSSVRHVELVQLQAARLLLVFITDTGRVEQRVVETHEQLLDGQVADLRTALNGAIAERPLDEVPSLLADLADVADAALRPLLTQVITVAMEALVEQPEERIVIGGAANLARATAADFPGTLRPVLEALEEHVVLMRLIGEAHDASTVTVRIGEENELEQLRSTSVVSIGYGGGGRALGGMGVLGPTRMNYAQNITAVQAVARYVGKLLGTP
ncbi:MAG TPA: heat-inducible transcriptional repressor HrcA [Mycobacteriales bacterium]